jgi:hypothetical protein
MRETVLTNAQPARSTYAAPRVVSRPVLLSLFNSGGSNNGPPGFAEFRRPRR